MPEPENGIAIALAWPQTACKQPGSWYDGLMHILGVSENRYYKVGHAAVLLINRADGRAHYFDFGRYHAPFGFGRVRSAGTDTDLELPLRAGFDSSGKLQNAEALLQVLQDNTSCHGEGPLYAAMCPLDFNRAYNKAAEMQEAGCIRYGPFLWQGSNCSRFVRTVILAGRPPLWQRLRLMLPRSISPTPKGNVRSLKQTMCLPKINQNA